MNDHLAFDDDRGSAVMMVVHHFADRHPCRQIIEDAALLNNHWRRRRLHDHLRGLYERAVKRTL